MQRVEFLFLVVQAFCGMKWDIFLLHHPLCESFALYVLVLV